MGKVGHSFVGETEWCKIMTACTFGFCAKRLVKLRVLVFDPRRRPVQKGDQLLGRQINAAAGATAHCVLPMQCK
jgi:hypothetical protein